MAPDVDVEELIREHIQARRATANPSAGFHHRLMARLDAPEPRRLGIVPQLAIALAIVLSVALVAIGLTFMNSQKNSGPAKETNAKPYTIASPPMAPSSCSPVPRQWAASPPNPAKMLSATTGWAYGPMHTTDVGPTRMTSSSCTRRMPG
jgi:hypothetical protein